MSINTGDPLPDLHPPLDHKFMLGISVSEVSMVTLVTCSVPV